MTYYNIGKRQFYSKPIIFEPNGFPQAKGHKILDTAFFRRSDVRNSRPSH